MNEKENEFRIVGKYCIETSTKSGKEFDYIAIGVIQNGEFVEIQRSYDMNDLKRYVLANSGIKVLKK